MATTPGKVSSAAERPTTGIAQAWSLNRVLVLLLTAGLFTLLIEIRFEHVDVVHERRIAWIPIGYSGLMTLLGLWAVAWWGPASRAVLSWFYALGLAVGSAGIWLHADGAIISSIVHILSAWFQRFHHAEAPPVLAPVAFCGIGLLGLIACAKAFQPRGRDPDAR